MNFLFRPAFCHCIQNNSFVVSNSSNKLLEIGIARMRSSATGYSILFTCTWRMYTAKWATAWELSFLLISYLKGRQLQWHILNFALELFCERVQNVSIYFASNGSKEYGHLRGQGGHFEPTKFLCNKKTSTLLTLIIPKINLNNVSSMAIRILHICYA